MEFESQEHFEFTPYVQMNWYKSDTNSNCNTWNQNMTEDMMNSYNSVPNCHSDMYYHHPNQQPPPAHMTPAQYEYYSQHTFYHQHPDNHHETGSNVSIHQNFEHYDYPAMQNSVESCDSMIEDRSLMNFQLPNMLDASQYRQISANNMNNEQENTQKPFHCYICNMWFSRLYHLKRHFESGTHKSTVKETNNNEDPAEEILLSYKQPKESQKYECQMCNKKYKNKVSLKRHLVCHNNLKNELWCQYNKRRINTEADVCCPIDCNTA